MADELELERFAILGVSGGGPYAAACTSDLSDRAATDSLVSTIGPPDAPRNRSIVVIAWLARRFPWIAGIPIKRTLKRARTDPDAAIEARAKGKATPEVAMHRGDADCRLNAQTAEAGTPHTWSTAGEEELHLTVRFEPALDTEAFLRDPAALAQEGKVKSDGAPSLLQVAALYDSYGYELLHLASPPLRVQKVIFGALAPPANSLGYLANPVETANTPR